MDEGLIILSGTPNLEMNLLESLGWVQSVEVEVFSFHSVLQIKESAQKFLQRDRLEGRHLMYETKYAPWTVTMEIFPFGTNLDVAAGIYPPVIMIVSFSRLSPRVTSSAVEAEPNPFGPADPAK